MKAIINEIFKLRNNKPFMPDRSNKNRYCIITNEANKHKTAYCFGVPIYNSSNRKLIDLKLQSTNNRLTYFGCDSVISFDECIYIENSNDSFKLDINDTITHNTENTIYYINSEVRPTLNGVLIKTTCNKGTTAKIKISSKSPYAAFWANNRCFCIMKSQFEPLLCVSCIGVIDNGGFVIAPIEMSYVKLNDYEVELEFFNTESNFDHILFEVNLHQNKLFQDTTVESANLAMNNVYGTTAFIGHTELFGEQWLYTRINYAILQEFLNRRIEKVIMHIPLLNSDCDNLTAYSIPSRFCSFGSNWDNKITIAEHVTDSKYNNGYHNFDITRQVIDPKTKYLKASEGVVIKTKYKKKNISVIGTGDSFYAPTILEIRYG